MVQDWSERGRVTPHFSHLVHTVLPEKFCPNSLTRIHTIRKETHTATCNCKPHDIMVCV